MHVRSGLTLALLLAASLGCASTEESAQSERPKLASLPLGQRVTAADSTVRTVQLHLTGDESAIPILPLGRDQTLTLAFDIMGNNPRPLSAFFYHADRSWRRDLVPAEFLDSFHRDDLLDYGSSRATQVPYVHYDYVFPNNGIGFRLSGNYIVRITEQGQEDHVLLERPFFVSEQSAPLNMGFDQVLVGGRRYASVQPEVSFVPPDQISGTLLDYTVCFVRNGLALSQRCSDRARLDIQPSIRFQLDPDESFVPQPAEYWLDLSDFRIGGRIERSDLSKRPYEVILEPDYFRFPGTAIAPLQNGQIVVNEVVQTVVDPGSAGEYALVQFSMVPDDSRPVPGRVNVVGSFNEWGQSEPGPMTWNAEAGRYETVLLLKQGAYEYRYGFTDAEVGRASMGASPRFDNVLTAFVYLEDVRVGTDRLVSAVSMVTN